MSFASSSASASVSALNTVLVLREGSEPLFDLSPVWECIRVNPALQVFILVCCCLYVFLALRYLYKYMFKKNCTH